MSYFDDNEDSIIFGHSPGLRREVRAPSAEPGSPLAAARQAAHRAFDPKWQSGKMSRSQAYNWLSQKLAIKKEVCHMLLFDIAMCERVVHICLADDFDAL